MHSVVMLSVDISLVPAPEGHAQAGEMAANQQEPQAALEAPL